MNDVDCLTRYHPWSPSALSRTHTLLPCYSLRPIPTAHPITVSPFTMDQDADQLTGDPASPTTTPSARNSGIHRLRSNTQAPTPHFDSTPPAIGARDIKFIRHAARYRHYITALILIIPAVLLVVLVNHLTGMSYMYEILLSILLSVVLYPHVRATTQTYIFGTWFLFGDDRG